MALALTIHRLRDDKENKRRQGRQNEGREGSYSMGRLQDLTTMGPVGSYHTFLPPPQIASAVQSRSTVEQETYTGVSGFKNPYRSSAPAAFEP